MVGRWSVGYFLPCGFMNMYGQSATDLIEVFFFGPGKSRVHGRTAVGQDGACSTW